MQIIIIFLAFGLIAFFPRLVLADYFVPQGGPAPQININKTVKNPQNGQFVDNLNLPDPHFLPEQDVVFRIEVKNLTGSQLKNITVKDRLPDFVDFVSGPGNFDKNAKTLTFIIDKLEANESKAFEIKVKVSQEKFLPNNQVTCVTNLTVAQIDQNVIQDSAAFCFEKQVLGVVKELPVTGPRETVALIAASTIIFSIGLFLLKRSSKENVL